MNKQEFVENVKRAENILGQYSRGMAGISADLKAEVQAAKRQQVRESLIDGPEGLGKLRGLNRAGVAELRAEREALADPKSAMLAAAWRSLDRMTPAQVHFVDSLRGAGPDVLAQALTLASGNAAVQHGLSQIVLSRRAEFTPDEQKALLAQVEDAGRTYVPLEQVREIAGMERRALQLELQIMGEIDRAEPAEKMTVARELEPLEALLNVAE